METGDTGGDECDKPPAQLISAPGNERGNDINQDRLTVEGNKMEDSPGNASASCPQTEVKKKRQVALTEQIRATERGLLDGQLSWEAVMVTPNYRMRSESDVKQRPPTHHSAFSVPTPVDDAVLNVIAGKDTMSATPSTPMVPLSPHHCPEALTLSQRKSLQDVSLFKVSLEGTGDSVDLDVTDPSTSAPGALFTPEGDNMSLDDIAIGASRDTSSIDSGSSRLHGRTRSRTKSVNRSDLYSTDSLAPSPTPNDGTNVSRSNSHMATIPLKLHSEVSNGSDSVTAHSGGGSKGGKSVLSIILFGRSIEKCIHVVFCSWVDPAILILCMSCAVEYRWWWQ